MKFTVIRDVLSHAVTYELRPLSNGVLIVLLSVYAFTVEWCTSITGPAFM